MCVVGAEGGKGVRKGDLKTEEHTQPRSVQTQGRPAKLSREKS